MDNYSCAISPEDFSPEFQFLLTCCRPTPSTEHIELQDKLIHFIQFEELCQLAKRHKVIPLLNINLKRFQHLLPTERQSWLNSAVEQNKQKIFRTLETIALLKKSGYADDLLLLKGLEAALACYQDISSRDVGDIDILVDKSKLEDVAHTLKINSWKPDPFHDEIIKSPVFQNHHKDVTFSKLGYPRLELHWKTHLDALQFHLPIMKKTVSNETFFSKSLSIEDHLIYLSVHGGMHAWWRLKWLFDIPNLIQSRQINWEELWVKARHNKVNLYVQEALLLSKHLCSLHLNTEMIQGFEKKNLTVSWRFTKELLMLSESSFGHMPFRITFKLTFNNFWRIGKTKKILRFISYFFYPSSHDMQLIPIPQKIHFLYFIIHPFTLLIRIANRQLHFMFQRR